MKFMIVIPIYVVFLSIRETKSASVSQLYITALTTSEIPSNVNMTSQKNNVTARNDVMLLPEDSRTAKRRNAGNQSRNSNNNLLQVNLQKIKTRYCRKFCVLKRTQLCRNQNRFGVWLCLVCRYSIGCSTVRPFL